MCILSERSITGGDQAGCGAVRLRMRSVRRGHDTWGDAEAVTEIGQERDHVFLASFLQRQEGVVRSSPVFAEGSAADFAQGNRITDFLFGDVGVKPGPIGVTASKAVT